MGTDYTEHKGHTIAIHTSQSASGSWTWAYVISDLNREFDNIGRRVTSEKAAHGDAKIAALAYIDSLK